MTEHRRLTTPSVARGGKMATDLAVVPETSRSEPELARHRLRQRWELASVLNFLQVFQPVIGSKMKISAEEIETALITPNIMLAQLHITLLKGIPPVSKSLNGSDAWVTVLCKKLAMWWPWVAEGDIPLTAAKGEEISRYKELDPTNRLILLKALCEVRADQDDTVAYINDALKHGTELSSFRKNKIGGDGNGTAFWCDGNAVIGHRLYKEVSKFESSPKAKGKRLMVMPTIISQWETLATNLDEFRNVVDKLLSSKAKLEAAVGKTVENDVMPILEKLHKKKERALKQQRRQVMLLNGSHNFGITRSCRSRRPVNYTFDDYDRAINEAIQLTKKRKTTDKQSKDEKHNDHGEQNENASDGCLNTENNSGNNSEDRHDSMVSDTESDEHHGRHDDNDYDEKDDGNNEDESYSNSSDMENNELSKRNQSKPSQKQNGNPAHNPMGPRWSKRLAGITTNHSLSETKILGAKNRSRQRPIRNSALESVVADSEDGQSSKDTDSGICGGENSPGGEIADDSDN